MTPRGIHTLVALLAFAVAGCGALETPDLEHGNVAGRIQGTVAGAYVYPLGAPEKKVLLAADGRFELAGLPLGDTSLMVFDGRPAGTGHAWLDVVAVTGAGRVQLDRDATLMPLAGRVVLAVVPAGGALPSAPRYAVVGTDQAGVASATGAAVLFPLAAGSYQVGADMDGYKHHDGQLQVTAGATGAAQIVLDIEGGATAGCTATGGRCRNELHCDTDGVCVQCRVGAVYATDCPAPGSTCDPATRFCTAATAAPYGAVCSICTADTDCAGTSGYCEKPAGAAPGDHGYCTRSDTSACPAGFTAATSPTRCIAPLGCAAYFQTFDQSCFDDTLCGVTSGIDGGVCAAADEDHGSSGRCTAPCLQDADCIVPGYRCDSTLHVCQDR
jgi:hypothetical protein